MSIKQIFQNFSWETLVSLQPTELLSLVALFLLALVAVGGVMFLIWAGR